MSFTNLLSKVIIIQKEAQHFWNGGVATFQF